MAATVTKDSVGSDARHKFYSKLPFVGPQIGPADDCRTTRYCQSPDGVGDGYLEGHARDLGRGRPKVMMQR